MQADYVPPPIDAELWKRKVLEARGMSFEQKFRLGPLLFEQECKKLKNHLRSEHRDAGEATINQMASDILEDIRRREDEKLIACGLFGGTTTKEVVPEGQYESDKSVPASADCYANAEARIEE